MILKKQPKRWVVGGAILLLVAGTLVGHSVMAESDDDEHSVALPAEQAISAIRAAVQAKPGEVLGFEAEVEGGKTHCEVKIVAADKKVYEVEVDVATGKVTEIEADDDEHEAKDDHDD